MAKDLDLSEFGGTPELDLSEFDQPAPQPASTARRAADTGLALGRGIVAVPETAVGLSNIVTGGRTGKAVERLGVRFKDAKQVLTDFQSDEQKAADAQVQQADGFLPTVGAMVENPSTIANAVAESVPSMLAGGAVSRGLVNKGVGAITAGAVGEGVVSAGSAAEQVRQEGATGFLTPKQAALAATSGAATGVLNRVSGKLADKLGIADVNTTMATGKLGGGTDRGILRRTAYGAVNEGVLQELPQSMQEQALQNLALDKPVGEGVAEAGAAGMLVGNLTGGAFGAVSRSPQTPSIETDSPDVGAVNPPPTAPGVSPSVQGGGIAPPQEPPKPPPAPPPPPPSKAQAMGINPAAGPLQAAAGVTVDTGADVITQDQEAQKQKAEAAAKEKAKPGADGKKPEPEAPPPVQPATPDPTAPITGPFTQAIHGASNVTPPPAPAVDPQGPAATQGAGTAVDAPAAPGVGADQGPQGAGPVPVAVPEPAPAKPSEQPDNGALKTGVEGVSAPAGNYKPGDKLTTNGRTFLVTGVAHTGKTITVKATDGKGFAAGEIPVSQPTQESTNATQQSRPGETIDPETGEITQSGPQGAGGDGGQRPADALQPGADAKGPQPAPGQPTAPAPASTPPEGKPASTAESVAARERKDRWLKNVADAHRLAGSTGVQIGGVVNGRVNFLGNPNATKQGRALQGSVEEAINAGATPQEIVDAAKKPAAPAQPKPPAPTTPVDMGAHTAATSPHNDRQEPTQAQKEAGNAKLGHIVMSGLGLSIENPEGSTRRSKPDSPVKWETTMKDGHYGYVKGSIGMDGDHVDTFIKPGTPLDHAGTVFVIDQIDPATGKPDEHKVMIGYPNGMAARQAYQGNYQKGWKGFKAITPMAWDEFKAWVKSDGTKSPAARSESAPVAPPPADTPVATDTTSSAVAPPAPDPAPTQAAAPSKNESVSPAAVGPSQDGTPDPAAGKWFGTKEKADAKLASMGLTETHEVVRDGLRFAFRKKALTAPAETKAPVPETTAAKNDTVSDLPERIAPGDTQSAEEWWGGLVPMKGLNNFGRAALVKHLGWHEDVAKVKYRYLMGKEKAELERLHLAATGIKQSKPVTPQVPPPMPPATNTGKGPTVIINKLGKDGLTDAERAAGKAPYNDPPPAPKKPEIVVDKAEIRPYRKPDGSIGYEAIPISPPTPVVEPEPKAKPVASANTIFTEDAAAAARARLKAKLGRLNSGLDPETMLDGITLAGYHIEKGARTFAAYAKAMLEDLGDGVKPYLKSWYMGVRYDPRASGFDGMSSAAEVDAVDLEALETPQEKADTAPDQPRETLLGASNDTGRNAADDRQLLDDAVPQPGQQDVQGGDSAAINGLRTPDPQADGRPEDDRSGRGDGLDGDSQPVLPGTPAEVRPLADSPVGRTEERPDTLAGENPGNFEITFDLRLGEGTDGQKIKANLDAIRTLRLVQKEGRFPTNEEQRVMARYVGWGGLKTVFDPNKKDATDLYGKAQRELRELLNLKEYRAANGSIRNAHYTAQGIVQGMWRVARHMGFKGGRVLEPTVGIGNFIGLQPKDMAASSEWHASELDTVTGEMAALLYPEANVLASTGFQDAPFADDAFDLVIGNPPFGQQTIDDKHPNRKHLSGMKIHNYIIAKSGMHLRPGGVMSLVVTHRFLDTANPEARDVLAGDFKFLGAFRLPNNAFAANAGTEVVTDVIFLQKLRPDEPRNRDASWLDVNGKINVDGQDIRVNRYYQDNPTHILGRSATDGTMYGGRTPEEGGQGEYTVHGDGRDLGQAIDNLITGGFADMAGIMERTGSDMSAAPAMLMQSDLPVGGVMLDSDGKIRRRELDDAYGNAVVVEITRETLWKEQAAEWQALQTSLLDIRERAKDGRVTAADAQEFLALARFTFKSDGTMRSKPTKAEAAVYKLVDALARPASFTWTYDDEGLQIGLALARKQLGADGYKSLKGMLDLRNRALRLIRAEQTEDPAMEDLRKDLNTAYDAFVKANGFLSDPRNSNLLDGDIGVEAGLEASFDAAISAEVSKSTGIPARKASATKADILKQRVNFPYKEITTAATSADALSVSLSEHGKVDLPYMAKITGKSILAVINDLSTGENPQLFRDPETNEFQEAERYLSGNVRHKLEVARERNETANIKALEKVQPEPKTKSNVTPNIRGMWVPEAIFTEFLQSIGYRTPRISILASQGIMTAEGGPLAITDFGTQFRHARATAVDMFNAAVAGKPLIIYDKDSNGNRVRNDTMTKEVTALVDRMAKVFQEWAYSDDRRADAIVAAFNEKMNTHVKRTYDGVKYLRQVGASPSIKLRRTQKNAAWRMIQEQTMLADHVVGAGKTFTLITGIMERRRMGLSRKPMVAVPNHLVVQWARDFYKLYPSAKVLAATPADFARKNRRRLLARIATGDYDAIIIGHSSLGFIETPADDLRAIVDEKLAGLRETMEVARANKESKRTLGQIEDRIERYEARLEQLAERPTDEIGIDFKSMGIDHLSVDEAHEFKNLEYSTSGDRVKGMNDPNGSKKAFDLYSKVRGLLGRKGGVVFATGTPVSNSLVEIYTVMSYLAHDELVLRNQDHFDSWSGAYASTETRLEYTSTQKLKPARVLAGLNNLSALRQLYEQFADIITMADLKRIYTEEKIEENKRNGTSLSTDFPIPRVRYGARQLNSGPVTKAQQEYMDYLVARMTVIEQRRADRAYPAIDNPLNVLTDARKMSLDIRIVDPTAPRDENGKVMRAARNIKAAYDASDANRGTQLVFCDLSTPAKTASKEAKRMVTEALTLLVGEKQVKANRARFDGLSFEKQWAMLREAADRIIDDPATDEQRRDQVSEYFNAIEDAEATMLTADIGFSVYDDMRTVLMEMGIPESEIAFIHDYNTPEQKEKLFDRVNNGYIRVLMGSTMKMGAGTNAQRRVVALHHMDAPWRPSDVEQREGRVIRQGNLFATLPELIQGGVNELYDPEFEVGIDAYSTENTSDTVMWQVLERKAGAIEQFRAGGLDSTEEEGGDSNQYAEFMASSTGNPVFRLKLEAERKLTELTADISGALITRSNAASFMQQYESRRASSVAMRDAAQAASGFTSASYGGQSGTVAEFEAAMKDAEAKYLERFAEYQTRRGDAETAIAAWELLPEKTRGEKPKIPTAPSRPNLMTNTVQAGSGFARAIGLALKEARVDKQVTITLSDSAKIVIYGEEVVWKDEKNNQWYARLQMGDQKVGISFGSGLKATDSSKLVYDLTPANIAQDIERALRNASEQVADLDARKVENERRAKLDIDTSKRDAAEAELRWYERQVRFAEIESDVRRSSRPNRYIARDRRRPLGQMDKVDLAPVQTIEVDGETYTTTGVQDGSGSYMNMQATRDSDGLPAVVQIRTAQGKNNETETSVVLQPSSIPFKPKPGKSTNLRQTGAPEGNDTDVVFARGSKRATGVHMDDAEAIIAQIREALPTAPPIIPLESIAQAPADLRKFIRDAGAQDDFEAAYHNGKIYVLPSNVGSATRLQFLLAHHEIRHHGLASMLGPRKNQVLFSIHATNANVRAAAAEQIRRGYATSKVLATEEALADMAVEDLVKLNGWDKIVAAVRQWLRGAVMRLRRAGLGRVADAIAPSEWTDKDVAYLIARAEGVSRGGSAKYASEGTVFGQDGDMPAFYSALTREINANTARAQPAMGWASTIQGLVKAGKIKQDEVDWSGVLDWLRLQGGKVTREQLVAFLDANGVRVEETVLGGGNKPPGYDADLELLSDNGLTLERNPEDPSMVAFMDENGDLLSADELAEEPGLAKELVLAAYRVQEAADADKVPTRYANYQLPGGSNYREVLLTLPTGGPSQVEALSDAELRALILRNDSNAEVDDVARADLLAMVGNMDMTSTDIAKLTGKNTAQYKSSHWDLPNILAHIRVNDRVDADGKRVLFVEELQSDWGQAGKKKGFGTRPQFTVRDRFGHLRGNFDSEAEAQAYIDNPPIDMHNLVHGFGTIVPTESVGIPAAPFVTKTDAWLSLALKRIVKMAVDEGYDRVAFVNGDQSAARYDLSKQVKRISWIDDRNRGGRIVTIKPEGGKDIDLRVADDGTVGGINFTDGAGGDFGGKKLSDVIGKDLADKVLATKSGNLSGNGLKVGGEGMKAFYDRIVPNTLKDVLRKVGGGALETVDIGDGVTSIGMVKMYTRRPATESEAAEHIDRTGSDEGLYIESDGKVIPVDDAVNFYPDQYDEGSVGDSYINAIINRGYGSKFYIERENAPMPQPGFTITPAMRSKVAGGLPLFARGDKITEFNSDGPAKEFERYKRLVDQVGQEYTAKGSTMTFEEFTAKVKPLQDKMWEAHFKLEKWKAGRPATSTEEVFPGFQEIPIGTRILATHGLKYPEPTMGTVVGRRGLRMGEKAYVLPEVDFGDGDGRAVLPGDIKEVFAGPRTMFARGGLDGVTDTINTTTKTAGNTAAHYRGLGLQALGRRQITELYGDILPQLGSYNTLMAQMDADKNEAGAQADQIAQDWGKLKDERQLAELMHDATLAQMDPEKPLMRGDDPLTYEPLRERYAALSPEAKKVYVDARDTYRTHHENVRKALRDRIERSELRGQRKAELLKQMDDEFYQSIKGVYFPLARFGDYVVIVRDPTGKTLSVNRAESINEAEALQVELRKAYPDMTVGKVLKSKEFNAGRDAVGRGFMQNLYEALGKADMDDKQRGDLEDMLGQLYLSALPDLSWAKHGIHRKGTPGFSQDARRAFAQNTFHGARYLAKVRYSDLLENELSDAQKQVDGMSESESFDSVKAQQVIDEMVKRHDAAMNPEGNSLSTALTSIGFVFHLGLSPASAVVNLTQTALVAYPIMGAKWGFDKAAAALLKASQQAAANRNDISAALSPEEKLAYNEAVRSGVIDVTMAHDLAGISQGEDAKVSWKLRPVMRWASFLFHHAEKFNRQATFVAAYRLAREAGSDTVQAYEQATKATYDGHFDYSNTNRPRIMQGNAAKVILLFKQYGQNMVYTLARQAYLSMKGKNQFERAQARKALGGLLTMHAAAAGVLGLPMVSTLLAAASMLGSDDDEPWDAEVALRNMLAEALGDQAADVLARGLSRLTPWDISGRVGLDKLILPDIQEGLEGQRLGESAMAAALGPVAGIGVALLKGMQEISDGNFARGLEAMAPSLLRGPARAVRYASEGAIDKTGKPIVEDVGAFGIAGQALGFSPSEVRLATEAKSAVHQADAKLAKRRATLMRHYAMAVIAGDEEGAADAREDIRAFNEKNPGRRINPLQMARSVATRKKQIAESQGGVYLPKTRRDAMEAGQFGMP